MPQDMAAMDEYRVTEPIRAASMNYLNGGEMREAISCCANDLFPCHVRPVLVLASCGLMCTNGVSWQPRGGHLVD